MTKDTLDLFIPRFPWPEDFPDVFIHTTLDHRDQHPSYMAAKSGSISSALDLAYDLLNEATVSEIRSFLKDKNAILAPVTAIETSGYNAIPDAMAGFISAWLNCDRMQNDEIIVQTNKVAHTRAKGFWRFVTPPQFEGTVYKNRNYFLIDDHVGHGSTLTNMRGYIEYHGGKVIGISTLTETRDAKRIRLEQSTLNMLRSKHGQDIDIFWRKNYGYGTDCLTNVEAGFLYREHSFDIIRKKLAQAASEVRASGLFPIKINDENLN